MPRDRLQIAALRHIGNRRQQASGVRMSRPREQRFTVGDFDDAPGIHHHHPVDQVLDHRKVVGHIHRRHAEAFAQAAQGREDVRLSGDVQRRGRFIKDDQLRTQDKRQRQHHPLLLPTGELMGEAPQKRRIVRQANITQGIGDALLLRRTIQLNLMCTEGFAQQTADAQRRVQRRRRVLRDVADQAATGPAQRFALQGQQRMTGHLDLPADNPRPASGMGEQRGGQGRLAGAGFADQPQNLACLKAERNPGQHVNLSRQLDPQIPHLQHPGSGHRRAGLDPGNRIHGCFSPIRELLRPMPSARILVP
ncbi:hypothetical protein D3C84_396660 [compost metagenome]